MGVHGRGWCGEERERRSRTRDPRLPWWQKALIGSVAAVASITAVTALQLWPGEITFDHMKPQSARQQEVQASTLRMLTDLQREQEQRQALQPNNQSSTPKCDPKNKAGRTNRYIAANRESGAEFAAGNC